MWYNSTSSIRTTRQLFCLSWVISITFKLFVTNIFLFKCSNCANLRGLCCNWVENIFYFEWEHRKTQYFHSWQYKYSIRICKTNCFNQNGLHPNPAKEKHEQLACKGLPNSNRQPQSPTGQCSDMWPSRSYSNSPNRIRPPGESSLCRVWQNCCFCFYPWLNEPHGSD